MAYLPHMACKDQSPTPKYNHPTSSLNIFYLHTLYIDKHKNKKKYVKHMEFRRKPYALCDSISHLNLVS